MNIYLQLSFLGGIAAVAYGLLLAYKIVLLPKGTPDMNKISDAIAEGAQAFLKREYATIGLLAAFITIGMYIFLGSMSAIGFLIGAVCSAVAGFIGMNIAVRANIRVAQAAKSGLKQALSTAFSGGAVTGLMVAGLALLAVSLLFFLVGGSAHLDVKPLIALGFGGSLISVFARLGGGIYTKGADVGTDMVGKIEKGIPEDDPRNPGVIADLVGDNVGDDAGMAADLFETYVVTAVAAILLGSLTIPGSTNTLLYPLMLGAAGIVASIIGTFFVRLGKGKGIMEALYKGLLAASAIAAILFYIVTNMMITNTSMVTSMNVYWSAIVGIAVTIGMVIITEYYTSKKYASVRKIADAANTGHGTNIIAGLGVSMKSTFLPVLLIVIATLVAYSLAGLFGIAVATMAMLALSGIVIAIDAFGPITDNAGGIAEMTNQPQKVRDVTDALDAVGNTTKAVTKGYAIASAGLAALVLFASYTQELGAGGASVVFRLDDPYVIIGLLIGAALPYMFGAMAMEAVGKAAGAVVVEVRRQFKTIKGIMDHGRSCVGQREKIY